MAFYLRREKIDESPSIGHSARMTCWIFASLPASMIGLLIRLAFYRSDLRAFTYVQASLTIFMIIIMALKACLETVSLAIIFIKLEAGVESRAMTGSYHVTVFIGECLL